jgi:formate hydrogenlyase transcriptional activator
MDDRGGQSRATPSPAEQERQVPEGLFRAVFAETSEAMLILDDRRTCIDANPAACSLLGASRDALVGFQIDDFADPRHRADIEQVWVELLAQRERRGECRFVRRDRTVREIEYSATSTVLPGYHVLILRDISRHKGVEDALRQSQETFHLLVDGVKDYAIFTLDTEGRVISWNAGAQRIKGYREEEIIGQHFSRFYTDEDIKHRKPERSLQVAAEQDRFEDEGWRVRKDGTRFWANAIITPLRDDAGQLRGFAKVTRDFTERRRAEESVLLEITNVLVSNLDIRRLLSAISTGIGRIVPHDYASLALYNEKSGDLRLQNLEDPYTKESLPAGMAMPLVGSPAGWAFTNREPLLLNHMHDDRFLPDIMHRLSGLGLKSGCWLPLISSDRVLGTLNIGTCGEGGLTERDVRTLTRAANQVALAIDNALTFRNITELKERLAEEKRYFEEELRADHNFEEIVGASTGLKAVLKQVETVAPTDATVLILGETGTGKELIARAIHNISARHEHTFVKLNCAAIPTGLLESELFGHEKGAFTGAISQRVGRLELAHRSTLFLDEVGDISLELQPKLLRVLQEKEFERLGSTRTISVDARLIAATNRDLGRMVAEQRFRSDLFYRLNVFPVVVPPLRDRREDIPTLVRYFVQKYAPGMNKRIETIPAATMEALTRWHWPGNVRELENFVERAVILSQGPVLLAPLTELRTPGEQASPPGKATLEGVERDHIIQVLRETGGVIGGPHGAAARLGVKRTTLNNLMRRLGISRKDL